MAVDPRKPVEYVVRGNVLPAALCMPVGPDGAQIICAAWKDGSHENGYWGLFDRQTGFPVSMLGEQEPTVVYNSQVVIRNVEKEPLSPRLEALAKSLEPKKPTEEQVYSTILGEISRLVMNDCGSMTIDFIAGEMIVHGKINVRDLARTVHQMVTQSY